MMAFVRDILPKMFQLTVPDWAGRYVTYATSWPKRCIWITNWSMAAWKIIWNSNQIKSFVGVRNERRRHTNLQQRQAANDSWLWQSTLDVYDSYVSAGVGTTENHQVAITMDYLLWKLDNQVASFRIPNKRRGFF